MATSVDTSVGFPFRIAERILFFCKTSQGTLRTLSEVSSGWRRLALPAFLRAPKFVADSGRFAETTSFRNFCKTLSAESTRSIGVHVRSVCISGIQMHLYDEMETDWLASILSACPHLEELVANADFVNDAAIDAVANKSVRFNSILKLSLAGAQNVSARGLQTLLNLVGSNVRILNLSGLSASATESVFANLRHSCPQITHLNVSGTLIADLSVLSLLELRKLICLDLSECARVSDNFALAFSNPVFSSPLKSIALRGCLTLTDAFVPHLSKSFLAKTLTKIDIRGCARIKFATENTWRMFAKSIGRNLQFLAMSHKPFDALMAIGSPQQTQTDPETQKRILAFLISNLGRLEQLVLSDISESSRNNAVWMLATRLPQIQTIHLQRMTFTSDFVTTDMYATVKRSESAIDGEFVDEFNKQFESRGRRMKIVVQDEDSEFEKL